MASMNNSDESIRQQAEAWEAVVETCKQLGFKFELPDKVCGRDQILKFIQELHNNRRTTLNYPNEKFISNEFRYGDDNTIHGSTEVNIERCNGKVVAVWFRCRPLPFTDNLTSDSRAKEMIDMYKQGDFGKIKAIIFEKTNEKNNN